MDSLYLTLATKIEIYLVYGVKYIRSINSSIDESVSSHESSSEVINKYGRSTSSSGGAKLCSFVIHPAFSTQRKKELIVLSLD
jgi:hypothetical protein